MNVSEAIKTKRAVRQFSAQPISDEVARTILNAGRRAQSAKNSQPWQFIVVRDRQMLEKLSKLGQWAGHLAGAAMAVGIVTPPPEQRWSILFDAGQAAAYLQLAAWEQGIGSAPATIYETEAARALLGYPPDMEMHVMLSFGYPAQPELLTQPNRKGGRNPLDQIVHWETW